MHNSKNPFGSSKDREVVDGERLQDGLDEDQTTGNVESAVSLVGEAGFHFVKQSSPGGVTDGRSSERSLQVFGG